MLLPFPHLFILMRFIPRLNLKEEPCIYNSNIIKAWARETEISTI